MGNGENSTRVVCSASPRRIIEGVEIKSRRASEIGQTPTSGKIALTDALGTTNSDSSAYFLGRTVLIELPAATPTIEAKYL